MAEFTSQEDVVQVWLELNTSSASDAIKNYVQAFDRDFKRLEQINKKTNRKLSQAAKDLWRQKATAARLEAAATEKIKANNENIAKSIEMIGYAQAALADAEQRSHADDIAAAKAKIRALQGVREQYELLRDEIEAQKEEIKKVNDLDLKGNAMEAGKVFGEGVKDAFQSLQSKDLAGIGGGIAKLTVAGIQKGLRKGGSWLQDKGKAMQEKAAKMQAAPGGGGPMAGLLKTFGGLFKTLGPVLNIVGKIGPMVGMVSSTIMALIKILIDAEAQQKEFNKSLLDTGGSLGHLMAAEGKAGVGARRMGKSLQTMYNDVMDDTENFMHGLNAEVAGQIASTLAQEGQSVKTLESHFETAKRLGQNMSSSFAAVARQNLAYSRAFGVSVQEITQLQGQVMRDTGSSFNQMNITFAEIARGATESGIATNQFFNIIRGVSADLALYNNRIGDAVKLLGKLGKVMSAKSAEKFMQTISGAVRGMSRVQRLQASLLAGKETTDKAIKEDVRSTSIDIAKKIKDAGGADLGDAQKIMAMNDEERIKAFESAVDKISDPKAKGALMEQITNLETRMTMAKKGQYGAAQAAAEGGIGAQYDMLTKAVLSVSGAKSIKAGVGSIGMEQMAENLGVSRETVNQMVMMNKMLDKQRAELKDSFAKDKEGTIKRLKGVGIEIKDAADIDALGTQGLLDAMSEGDKKALEDATAIHDYSKETAGYTKTTMDRLQEIIDILNKKIADFLYRIMSIIVDLFGDDNAKAQATASDAFAKLSEEEKQKAAAAGSEGTVTGWGKIADKGMEKGDANSKAWMARDALANSKEWQAFMDRYKKSDAATQAGVESKVFQGSNADTILRAAEGAFGKDSEQYKKIADEQGALYKTVHEHTVDPGTGKSIASTYQEWKGGDVAASLKQAGLTSEDMQKLMQQSVWAADTGVSPETSLENVTGFTKNLRAGEDLLNDADKKAFEEANKKALEATGATEGNSAMVAVKQEGVDKKKSLGVHDAHAEPILEGILAALGGEATDPEDQEGAKKSPVVESLDTLNETATAILETNLATTEGIDDLWDVLRIKGIRLAKVHLENDIARVIEDSTLKSIQQGLFEYYLYKDKSQTELRKFAEDGGFSSIGGVGKALTDKFWAGKSSGGGGGGDDAGGDDAGGGAPSAPTAGAPSAPAAAAANHKLDITTNVVLTMKDDLKKMIEVISQDTVVKELSAAKTR